MDLIWETAPGLGARKYGDLEKTRGGIILRTFLLQPYPLVRADLLLQGPSALTNKAPNRVKSRRSHADPSRKKRR
jgi:hypothetical protein